MIWEPHMSRHQLQPLLNLLSTVQKTIHNGIWLREERRVRSLAGVCDRVLAQHRGKLGLNSVGQGTVIFTEEVHALHILPRLVGNLVPEDLGGLVLEPRDGGLLQVGRDVVVENLLRGL